MNAPAHSAHVAKKVLLIGDSEESLRTEVQTLGALGALFFDHCSSTQAVLAKVSNSTKHGPLGYDVVVCGETLAGESIYRLLQQLSAHNATARLPILLIASTPESSAMALENGLVALCRPYSQASFAESLKHAMSAMRKPLSQKHMDAVCDNLLRHKRLHRGGSQVASRQMESDRAVFGKAAFGKAAFGKAAFGQTVSNQMASSGTLSGQKDSSSVSVRASQSGRANTSGLASDSGQLGAVAQSGSPTQPNASTRSKSSVRTSSDVMDEAVRSLRAGNLEQAEGAFLALARRSYDNAEAYLGLARVKTQQKKSQEAVACLVKAAAAFKRQNKFDKARAVYAMVPENAQTGDIFLQEATICLRQGEYREAAFGILEHLYEHPQARLHLVVGRLCQLTDTPEESLRKLCEVYAHLGYSSISQRLYSQLVAEVTPVNYRKPRWLDRYPRLREAIEVASYTTALWRQA